MEKEQKTEVKQEAKADKKVVKTPIMVERETYEKNEKTYYTYFIRGKARGRNIRASVVPPDVGGYKVLDIVFDDALEAELVITPFEIKDDHGKVVKGNTYKVVSYDPDGTEYGYVGDIVKTNPQIVLDMLEKGYIPVVTCVAAGIDDTCNYNINADTAAEKLAIALKAKKLIMLTDVRGLLRDPSNESTLIKRLKVSEVPSLVREGIIKGGMIPKVNCCVECVRQGVERANIQDGRVPHSILIELLTNEGVGTMFS